MVHQRASGRQCNSPLEGLKIPYRKDILTATPFKKSSDKDSSSIATLGDINKILEQNNYTNQILHVVSKQIEETSSGLKPPISIAEKPSTSSPHIETNPIFKIPEFSKENYPKLSPEFSKSSVLLERINDELSKLNISRGDKLSTLLTQANRHPHKKNFYSKPSFPDVQFEENHLHIQSSTDGSSIIEWNIDGMAEGQIYNLLQEMGMTITAYKLKGASDKQSATMLVAGFTGTLKNWWDNYLTEGDRNSIQNSVTTKVIVKTEGGMERTSKEVAEDATTTLLYCIAKHFLGEPKLFQDRSLEILNNLYCKKLTDLGGIRICSSIRLGLGPIVTMTTGRKDSLVAYLLTLLKRLEPKLGIDAMEKSLTLSFLMVISLVLSM